MSTIKEQAVQMINILPDDNVIFLVDLMEKFMIPKETVTNDGQNKILESHTNFMQELENMRIKAKPYFPLDLETEKIWREVVDEKYSSFS